MVVSKEYLSVLQEKAAMIDIVFKEDEDLSEQVATVAPSDFKKIRELQKRLDKVDTEEIDYVEHKES